MIIMTIGERIKQRRIELGLSQEDLAKKMGYSTRNAIYQFEKKDNMKLSLIQKFADALDCTPSFLMGWEDEDGNAVNISFDVKLEFDPSAYRKDFLQRAVSYYSKINRLPPEYQTELENYLEYLQNRSDSHQTK